MLFTLGPLKYVFFKFLFCKYFWGQPQLMGMTPLHINFSLILTCVAAFRGENYINIWWVSCKLPVINWHLAISLFARVVKIMDGVVLYHPLVVYFKHKFKHYCCRGSQDECSNPWANNHTWKTAATRSKFFRLFVFFALINNLRQRTDFWQITELQ